MLLSLGLHDITPETLEQLRQRQPARRDVFPDAPPVRVTDAQCIVRLRERYRTSRRRRGGSLCGSRNEYLRALAVRHVDLRADSAVGCHERFAGYGISGRLPAWFMLAWSSAALSPIRRRPKPGRTAAQTPPRPIIVGEVGMRAITTELTEMAKPIYRDHLLPQQLAIGVSGAGERFVHAARLSCLTRRGAVLCVLDATDAYQHLRRSVALTRLGRVRGLEAQTAWWHARHGFAPYLFLGAERRRLFGDTRQGDSEEGVGQGESDAGAGYCVGTHDELVAFDQSLAPTSGWARGYLDDVGAFDEPEQVFDACVEYILALARETGVHISGVQCYSVDHDLSQCPHMTRAAQRAGVPFTMGTREVLYDDGTRHTFRGIELMGAPIGEAGFEEAFYAHKVDGSVGRVDETVRLLRHRSPCALHALTYSSLQHLWDYRMRCASGSDAILPATASFDRAIDRALAVYVPAAAFDDLLRRRTRLPGRDRGLGIRCRVWLYPSAFLGGFVSACESFLDTHDGVGDDVEPGTFPSLTGLFGSGAFDRGTGHRFASFLASGLHVADTFRSHWLALQAQLGGTPAHGPLSLAAADAGDRLGYVDSEDGDQSPRLQRALCRQLEQHEVAQLDAELRLLPPITLAGLGVIPDPRLSSWAEMCSIGRSWVSALPSRAYQPTAPEFREEVATYLGAPSPLAASLGIGRPVRSAHRGHRGLLLDAWGFALTAAMEPAGQSVSSWRVHHDALAHLFYGDALRAGIAGRTEPHGIFSSLLPEPVGRQRRARREGLIADALLDRLRRGSDDEWCPHLHDLKLIHMCQSRYTQSRVLHASPARCADVRADAVHPGYVRHARALDARHHAGVLDADARPILARLLQYPEVRGDCVGAFAECSADVHSLLRDTVSSAAEQCWREAGATSARAAQSVYTAIYRRRWGCEAALQGARMKLSRGYLVSGVNDGGAPRGGGRPTFDPRDPDHFAAAASPVLRGTPAGQRN